MKKNKMYFLCMFVMLLTRAVCALDVEITNSIEDMMVNKKLWLHIALGPEEVGVLKRSVQFSIDQPELLLQAWHPLAQWRPLFLPSFKKIRNVIIGSFAGWLAIDCDIPDDIFTRQALARARLHVSCLVLQKNDVIVPANSVVFLDKVAAQQSTPINISDRSGIVLSKEFRPSVALVAPVHAAVPALDEGFSIFDSLAHVWVTLLAGIQSIFQLYRVVLVLIGLGFLMVCFRLRRRYRLVRRVFILPEGWEYEMRDISLFLAIGGLIYFVIPQVSRSYACYVGSVFCFIIMIRIFMITPFETTFWLRLKSLIGFVMGVAVLPLLLKGYLLQCGF